MGGYVTCIEKIEMHMCVILVEVPRKRNWQKGLNVSEDDIKTDFR